MAGTLELACRVASGPDGLWHGCVRASDLRDDVLPEDLGDLVVALLPVVTSHEAALVAWFVVDSERALPSVISDGQIGNESQGTVFYRFCAPDSLSAQLKATWASHLGSGPRL